MGKEEETMIRDDVISIAVFLRELNCFNIDSLENRIIVQKKIFLTEKMGLNLGYAFSWYIHGPYCPQLTEVVYECHSMGLECFARYSLTDIARNVVTKVNELDELSDKMEMDRYQWLELLSSLVFWREDQEKQEAINDVKMYKPQFTEEQIQKAVSSLENYSILWG